MERQNNSFERRAYPRFSISLPIKICGTNFSFSSETKNISRTGLYCQVDRFMPVMTKLALTMFISLIIKKRKMEKEINCSVVVVRVEPEEEQEFVDKYNIGLFFTDIKDKDRDIISQYIQQAFFASSN